MLLDCSKSTRERKKDVANSPCAEKYLIRAQGLLGAGGVGHHNRTHGNLPLLVLPVAWHTWQF